MPQDSNTFINEEVNEVMGKSPSWLARWGNLLSLLIVVIMLVLSAFIYYPDVITGQAEVDPSGYTTIHSPKFPSQIIYSNARDGERVKKGAILYILAAQEGSITFDTITAPHAGLINIQRRTPVRATLSPGLPLAIVQQEAVSYKIYIQVPPYRAGKIDIGQTVYINSYQFPKEEFGELRAEIISKPLPGNKGLLTVEAMLSGEAVTTNGSVLDLDSKLLGTASIIIENRTLFSRFFSWL